MSKFLTPESVATRPDSGYFSPEKLAMLKRIFDSVCKEKRIVSQVQRDDLAVHLLVASKFTDDEATLIAVLKHDISGLGK